MTVPARQLVHSAQAPRAIGPYSQGVVAGNMLFTAGQIGINPGTGDIVEGGVVAQTRQVLTNLQHVLTAGGASLEAVLKTTVYLSDMNDFAAMNQVYGEFFAGEPPARSTVAVAALPKGGLVEIEAIAIVPKGQK